MPLRQRAGIAVATLGRFKGFLVDAGADGERWIEVDRSDLIGTDDRIWITPATGGRHTAAIRGRGARKAAHVYRGIHGSSPNGQRWIRDRGIPRSASYKGEAMSVTYKPAGVDRPRRHDFKNPRPEIWATDSALYVFGGRFKITRYGIVG